jgi:hypothetical protein
MSLYVECKPDETVALALGVPRREIIHASGSGGVCSQLARHSGVAGMVDEDPHAAHPPYLKALAEKSWQHEIRELWDEERKNRVIVLSPRLEDWVVATTNPAKQKMTDFGFDSDTGVKLHGEINQRLPSLKRLLEALLAAKSPRILRLQSLLTGMSK